jgi:mannose/fructose-specific phosphotransferase system component IIA
MIQVLLLTRGELAEEWLRATEAVCGCPAQGIAALTLDWDGDRESDAMHVRNRVLDMRQRGPLLILTDLHGSTPTNLAAAHCGDPEVAVVAGANLAMVLRLACDDRESRPLGELTEWICAKGRAAITPVSAVPAPVDAR